MIKVSSVQIYPPIKKKYLASASLHLSDGHVGIVMHDFLIKRSHTGQVYVTVPAISRQTPSGWCYEHVLEFSDNLWEELTRKILIEYVKWTKAEEQRAAALAQAQPAAPRIGPQPDGEPINGEGGER